MILEHKTETKREVYQYGLQARPFNADPALSSYSINFIPLEEVSDEAITSLGRAVRHGIISTTEPLSDEVIQKHELIDIQKLLNSPLNKVKDVVAYLITHSKEDMYLTKAFYNTICMTEDEFISLLCEQNYESEAALFNEVSKSIENNKG